MLRSAFGIWLAAFFLIGMNQSVQALMVEPKSLEELSVEPDIIVYCVFTDAKREASENPLTGKQKKSTCVCRPQNVVVNDGSIQPLSIDGEGNVTAWQDLVFVQAFNDPHCKEREEGLVFGRWLKPGVLSYVGAWQGIMKGKRQNGDPVLNREKAGRIFKDMPPQARKDKTPGKEFSVKNVGTYIKELRAQKAKGKKPPKAIPATKGPRQ